MNGAIALVLATILSVPMSFAMGQAPKKKADPTKGGGDKGTATLSEVQWQTWGPTACMPLHPGALPAYRGKSAKFVYELRPVAKDAPANVKTLQPYYLTPAADNPIVLYAGQELIVQVAYTFSSDQQASGATKEEALEKARKLMDAEVPLITVDIGSNQATALNPAPVRPSQGQSTMSIEGFAETTIRTLYACAYKKPLVGDTVPTVTVTALVKTVTEPLQLLQTSLPQVHTLSYFNIATGLIASTVRDKTFSRVESAAASGSAPLQFKTVTQTGDPKVMPALFFTAYLFRPIDAEVPFERGDLIPQPSVGFSLSSPSTDFMFGFSSEFFKRNIQLVYGYHYGQTTHLVPGQIDDPTSKDAPQTIKRFDGGAFVGLTFNIDFIKGLFGGGGSSKGQ
jgi:hypothetical protein